MIRAVCPDAVSDLKTGFITGWNVSPNIAYTITVVPGASSCAVWLFDAATGAYLAGGAALTGTDQPVTLLPATSPGVGMVDTDLGYHLLVTTDGTEDAQTYGIGPFVDGQDQLSAIYTVDNLAVVQATAVIREGTHYTDDASIMCPLGFDGLLGDIVSATVHGASIVGDIESTSFQAGPSSMADVVTLRRMSAILPDAPVVIVHPTVSDDTAETDASTVATGYVLTNDSSGLTVVAVDGIAANVGVAVPGSNGGVFTIAADGSWTFDPDGDFAALSGSDTAETSVTYHASNGVAESMATLTVTVSTAGYVLWTPAEITTALWLDAADPVTISVVSNLVAQWADKSGNWRHAEQSNASSPVYTNNGIVFTSGALSIPPAAFPTSGYTLMALMASTSSGSGSVGLINIRDASNGDPELRIGIGDLVYDYFNGGYALNAANASCLTMGIVSVEHTADVKTTLRKNGNLIAEATRAGATSPAVEFSLGTYAPVGSYRNGTIREIAVFQTSLENRQKAEGYLAHKWDALLGGSTLRDALPTGHPYKSAAPTI